MKARLEALLRRLGPLGVLGIGVLLASAGFYASALAPLQEQTAAQKLALDNLRSRKAFRPMSNNRAEELYRFYALFPPASDLTAELERMHRIARGAGLDLSQGEYRLERRASGLWAYRVTLPVRGTYPQLRGFLAAVTKDMPIASIDALRFERKKAADTQLEAQVRVTLHARPPEKP
jgi:hypothetical protein